MENRLEFIKSTWFMWIALIFFGPFGIFLMWKYNDRLSENKKLVLSVVFSVFFVFIWVPSCIGIGIGIGTNPNEIRAERLLSENKQIVQEVENKIAAIGDPETITLDKSQTVKDARNAYDELTDDQKALISSSSLKNLETSEKTISTLASKAAADKAAADKAAADKAAADKAAADKAAADKAAADKAAADKAAADKAAADKAAADKAAAASAQNSASSSSSSSGQTQSSSETIGTTVYITDTGTKYHSDGCSSLNKSKISISLADAKAQGYTACSKCHPPQ